MKIADTLDYADTSMEDMQAVRIGRRDILAIGLQDCGNSATAGTVGLELYDITNPRNPQFLTLFNGEDFGMKADHGHVHEFDIVKRRDGRVLAALASPDSEVITSDAQFMNGIGDAMIVDITNPSSPALIGEYGVLDDPMFGVPFYVSVLQGGDARTLDHSVRWNQRGTRLYVSYWDAGVIILDTRDPTDPFVIGRTAYAQGEEGNAHSIDTHETRRSSSRRTRTSARSSSSSRATRSLDRGWPWRVRARRRSSRCPAGRWPETSCTSGEGARPIRGRSRRAPAWR